MMDQGEFARVDPYNRRTGAKKRFGIEASWAQGSSRGVWMLWVSQLSSMDQFRIMWKRKIERKVERALFTKVFVKICSSNKNYNTEWGRKHSLNCCRNSMAQNKGEKAFNKYLLSLTSALLLPSCSISISYFLEGAIPSWLSVVRLGQPRPSSSGHMPRSWPIRVTGSGLSHESSQWDSIPGLFLEVLRKTFLSTSSRI